MTSTGMRRQFSSMAQLGLAAIVAAVWLMAHPYFGVYHDALLYTAQALNRLWPDIYGRDLYFRYGSQDQFTVFSSMYAWAIAGLGIDRAALLLTAIGKLLWCGGLVFFLASYLRQFPLWLGMIVVAGFSSPYDGAQIFFYGESFVTPRPYAEALCLLALGLVVRGREVPAGLALLLALVLHPLMALPGLVAAGLFSRLPGRLLLSAGFFGMVVATGLGLIGVEPFVRLVTCFDATWLDLVEKHNSNVFVDTWRSDFLGQAATLATILWFCRRLYKDDLIGRLAGRSLLLGFGGLLVAWLGASVFHNVLLTQLQVWRVLWIVQIIALSLLGALSVRLWPSGRAIDRVLLIGLWSALVLKGLFVGALVLAVACIWLALDRHRPDWRPTKLIWLTMSLLPFAAVVTDLGVRRNEILMWHGRRPVWQLLLGDPVLAVLVFALLVWLVGRWRRIGSIAAGLIGGGVLLVAVPAWFSQSEENWESAGSVSTLRAIVPIGATVYWPDTPEGVWFWLRRAQYASRAQGVGTLYSRDTAMLSAFRQARLLALGFGDGDPYLDSSHDALLGVIDARVFRPGLMEASSLCQDPELDYLVFPAKSELAPIGFRFTYPFDKADYDLLDCHRLSSSDPPVK